MKLLPLLLLGALVAPAVPALAQPMCVPGGPLAAIDLACTIDDNDDGLPDAAVLGLPAQVQNDLGTFDIVPQARVVPDRDHDLLPEELMADLVGAGHTESRDPGVHVGLDALNGDPDASVSVGTGYTGFSAGFGADAQHAAAGAGLDAVQTSHTAEASLAPDDANGDGVPDAAPLTLDVMSPFDEEHVRWALPPL
jgi:hypothetical protein